MLLVLLNRARPPFAAAPLSQAHRLHFCALSTPSVSFTCASISSTPPFDLVPSLLSSPSPTNHSAHYLPACPISSLAAILIFIFPNNSNPNAVSFECLWILHIVLAQSAFRSDWEYRDEDVLPVDAGNADAGVLRVELRFV